MKHMSEHSGFFASLRSTLSRHRLSSLGTSKKSGYEHDESYPADPKLSQSSINSRLPLHKNNYIHLQDLKENGRPSDSDASYSHAHVTGGNQHENRKSTGITKTFEVHVV